VGAPGREGITDGELRIWVEGIGTARILFRRAARRPTSLLLDLYPVTLRRR
jgi:hypothetical protein